MTKKIASSGFAEYLLIEQRSHLAQKIGDILTAVQNLNDDANHLGVRPLSKAAKGIVNQIRRILHDKWDDTEKTYLKSLQKVAVALMKAIDEDGNLKEVLASSAQELEKATGDLGEPIHQLGTDTEISDVD